MKEIHGQDGEKLTKDLRFAIYTALLESFEKYHFICDELQKLMTLYVSQGPYYKAPTVEVETL